MKGKRKFFGRIISFLTVFSLTIPMAAQPSVSAEETEKYQYSLFGRNGITMTVTSNIYVLTELYTQIRKQRFQLQTKILTVSLQPEMTLKKE